MDPEAVEGWLQRLVDTTDNGFAGQQAWLDELLRTVQTEMEGMSRMILAYGIASDGAGIRWRASGDASTDVRLARMREAEAELGRRLAFAARVAAAGLSGDGDAILQQAMEEQERREKSAAAARYMCVEVSAFVGGDADGVVGDSADLVFFELATALSHPVDNSPEWSPRGLARAAVAASRDLCGGKRLGELARLLQVLSRARESEERAYASDRPLVHSLSQSLSAMQLLAQDLGVVGAARAVGPVDNEAGEEAKEQEDDDEVREMRSKQEELAHRLADAEEELRKRMEADAEKVMIGLVRRKSGKSVVEGDEATGALKEEEKGDEEIGEGKEDDDEDEKGEMGNTGEV
jgi:hypothetical protein